MHMEWNNFVHALRIAVQMPLCRPANSMKEQPHFPTATQCHMFSVVVCRPTGLDYIHTTILKIARSRLHEQGHNTCI